MHMAWPGLVWPSFPAMPGYLLGFAGDILAAPGLLARGTPHNLGSTLSRVANTGSRTETRVDWLCINHPTVLCFPVARRLAAATLTDKHQSRCELG